MALSVRGFLVARGWPCGQTRKVPQERTMRTRPSSASVRSTLLMVPDLTCTQPARSWMSGLQPTEPGSRFDPSVAHPARVYACWLGGCFLYAH